MDALNGSENGSPDDRLLATTRNQALFREVNERVEELNLLFSHVIPIGDFVCECADTACTERIGMTIVEYEALRATPERFAVRAEHVDRETDHIVDERTGHTIVEKRGAAAEYAIRTNPRNQRRPQPPATRAPGEKSL